MNAATRETREKKLADAMAYPPRLLRADRAAAYVAMSTSEFLRLVADGELPRGIKMRSMVFWDRLELDAAVENWKAKQGKRQLNPMALKLGIEVDDHDPD